MPEKYPWRKFEYNCDTRRQQHQQSGNGNGSVRRGLSPGPGSDTDDSDISLGGTSPQSPSSSPPPSHHQQTSPIGSLGGIGPIRTPSLNFRFDPSHSFRFGPTPSFKFPGTGFLFEPHSPQHSSHHPVGSGGIFRLTETSPFQAVGPRGDLGSRLPDPLGLAPPPRLYAHETLLHHPHPQLAESISRLSDTQTRLSSDGGLSSDAHSPPLVATNLSVSAGSGSGPLHVAVPSPHTPSSRGSPPSNSTPATRSTSTPPPPPPPPASTTTTTSSAPTSNPKPPQIHRPFSPA
ncbi:hypothetical protein TKK_0008611 [Trichogramma kaykai]